MEISIDTISIVSATLLTGLSAGLFLAWQVSVIPGTLKVSDATYLHTMQSINKEILNPPFFIIFFGSLLVLIISIIFNHENGSTYWLSLGSTLIYFGGTILITSLGNVPLNNELEALNLAELDSNQLSQFRAHYEPKWNVYHSIRTVFSVLSFILILLAAIHVNG